jgi:hypothetical protein
MGEEAAASGVLSLWWPVGLIGEVATVAGAGKLNLSNLRTQPWSETLLKVPTAVTGNPLGRIGTFSHCLEVAS